MKDLLCIAVSLDGQPIREKMNFFLIKRTQDIGVPKFFLQFQKEGIYRHRQGIHITDKKMK
jgi:hypothetical protein